MTEPFGDQRGRDPATLPEDPWPHSPYPPLEPDLAVAGRRLPRWMISVGFVTAVLAAVSFIVVLAWPSGPGETGRDEAYPFRPREQLGQLAFPEPSENTFTQLVGDRAFVAWQQGADLAVTAAELDSVDERLWTSTITGEAERYWGSLLAGSGVVVALGYPSDSDSDDEDAEPEPLPMVVLSAETGAQLWDRDIYPYDQVWVGQDVLILVDRDRGAVRGLDPDSGRQRWWVPFPGWVRGAEAAVVPVLSEAHLTGVSGLGGTPVGPPFEQLLLVGEDTSARLIRVSDGEVVQVGTNVAAPDAVMLAYQDRLVVAHSYDGYRIEVRDLGDLAAQPRQVYATPDPHRRPVALSPCGADRLCVLDRLSWDEGTTQVRAIDLAPAASADPERWHAEAPHAYQVVAVGEWLLVGGGGTPLVGYDADGETVFSQPDGAVVRLDPSSLLLFAATPESYAQDLSVAGMVVGGERVELGQLTGVHGGRCSWNATHLVCPGNEGAGVWRFTDPE